MANAALVDVLKRAESWPVEDQRKLAAAARLIEAERDAGFDLNSEDWDIIDRRLAAATQQGLAADADVEALFAKYRAK